MNPVRIEWANAEHAEEVSQLFLDSGSPCFCQYHQFEGDHRAWQDQCANRSTENRSRLERDLEAKQVLACVALSANRVVGWCRFQKAESASKLYNGRLYRGLSCFSADRKDVYVMTCFLVHPEWRRNSVARALLREALVQLDSLGAEAIEAFPCGATDVPDEQQWLGPLELYLEMGFKIVHDFRPYPVVRREFPRPTKKVAPQVS